MLAEIKKYFNISLISIAKFTDIPLYTLRSISAKRRSISYDLSTKLLMLYNALLLNTPITDLLFVKPFLKQESDNILPVLKDALISKQKLLVKLENELIANKESRLHWLHGLNACYVLLNDTDIVLTKDNVNWIKLRVKHLKQRLSDVSISKEMLLMAKISGLKNEIDVIEKALL